MPKRAPARYQSIPSIYMGVVSLGQGFIDNCDGNPYK